MDPLPFYPILLVPIISGGISCVMSLLNIFLTVFINGLYKSSIGKMVIFLSLMDICSSATFIVDCLQTVVPMEGFSNFLCLCATFGTMAISCCFAHAAFEVVKYGGDGVLQSYHSAYLWLSTLVFFFGIPWVFGVLSPFWQLIGDRYFYPGAYLIAMIVSFIICFFHYYKVVQLLRIRNGKMAYEFFIYPAIFIICGANGLLVILNIFSFLPFEFWNNFPFILCASLWQMQGFFHALVFGLYRQVIQICCISARKDEALLLDDSVTDL